MTRVTVFTSNQPRHIAFINRLSLIFDEVFAVVESNTLFPGRVDDFFRKSELMKQYFSRVLDAEKLFFGNHFFTNNKVKTFTLKSGDLNFLSRPQLSEALNSDYYIIFGASYIKGWLIDFLVEHFALNIHMGLSPYYRGSSCNFWALYDNNPHYVGATIHLLSKGLDSGPILYHAIPKIENYDPFEFAMKAVDVAQYSIIENIKNKKIESFGIVPQDKTKEIRYTKNVDFNDHIVSEYLRRDMNNQRLYSNLLLQKKPELYNLFEL